MRVSKTIEQACGILIVLAEHHNSPVTNFELNQRLEMSLSYLTKLTRRLVKKGIITSAKGMSGGFVLARAMSEITLLMVVEAIEGTEPSFTKSELIQKVLKDKPQIAKKGIQALEEGFAMAERAWRDELDKVTMESLVKSSLEGREKND